MTHTKHPQPPVPDGWAPGSDVLFNPWMSNQFTGQLATETEFILRDAALHPGLPPALLAKQTTIQETAGNQMAPAQGGQSPIEKKVGGVVRFADVTRHG